MKMNFSLTMMKKMTMIISAVIAGMFSLSAQVPDTTGIYGERADSLDATVFVSRQDGTYLSRGKELRTEVISAAGLCKMACCNLAESFENSASVTVGYSDAVTGARQIRLLGLSGTYTQMLDENRPVMRGLASPFGLSYVPGQWLSSIMIGKGSASVINGAESITGQINLEHRKPTDEKPLFINAAVMADSKMDLNIASSLQMNENWSTIILGHVSGNVVSSDHNSDGFMDEPKMLQLNLANRWLYQAPGGLQLRFGVRALRDSRMGGQYIQGGRGIQPGYDKDKYSLAAFEGQESLWGSDIINQSINGYVKLGVPLNDDNTQNLAVVADYNHYKMDSYFGATSYLASQNSGFVNLLYQNHTSEIHKFTLGLSATYDRFDESFIRKTATFGWKNKNPYTTLIDAGVLGEYTYSPDEKLSVIAGLRADWYNLAGVKVTPRITIKYSPDEDIVIRANGGRGLRYASPIVDNIGILSTGKAFYSEGKPVVEGSEPEFLSHSLEDAWTFGGNITYYLPFGQSSNTYISFDYFRTQFTDQLIVDYEHFENIIDFYRLDGRSFTDSYQLDFSVEPIERFTITTTFRYTNAKVTLANRGLVEKPMTSRFKGVLNLQYATNLNKWIFDFTASLNGGSRVYDFMAGQPQIVRGKDGFYHSPAYPLLYLQVTKRFKGVDVYVGGENLTNFRQKTAVMGDYRADGSINPASQSFDASCIWGPIMGAKFYAGVRFTLWKK